MSGKEFLGEKALLDEEIWNIMNMIALQEHLVELYSITGDKDFLDLLDEARKIRKYFVNIVFNIEFSGSEKKRSMADNAWCCIKHICSILMHSEEVIEKLTEMKQYDLVEKVTKVYKAMWVILFKLIDKIKKIGVEKNVQEKMG